MSLTNARGSIPCCNSMDMAMAAASVSPCKCPNAFYGRKSSHNWIAPSASMRDAKELIQSGAVLSIPPTDAASLISNNRYKLIDVRPKWERQNAFIAGSYHVPLFVEDEDMSPVTLLKKWIHFGYIGMWMGHKLTTTNSNFLNQAHEAAGSKEDKLLVACGEGLRSLLAVEMLHTDGYKNLAWIDGGFGAAKDSDFSEVVGTTEIQYANIGGFAQYFLKIILLFQGNTVES